MRHLVRQWIPSFLRQSAASYFGAVDTILRQSTCVFQRNAWFVSGYHPSENDYSFHALQVDCFRINM